MTPSCLTKVEVARLVVYTSDEARRCSVAFGSKVGGGSPLRHYKALILITSHEENETMKHEERRCDVNLFLLLLGDESGLAKELLLLRELEPKIESN